MRIEPTGKTKGADARRAQAICLIYRIAGLATVLSLNGCATAPPLRGRADLLNFITDGKTTKEEVLNSLGQPSGRFESEKVLTYRLGYETRNNGYYPVEREVALRGYWALTRFSLVLVFDDSGVLRKHAVVPLYRRPELLGFLADGTTTKEIALLELGQPSGWFESEKILTYRLGCVGGEAMLRPLNLEGDTVPANLDQEQVWRVYPKCFWYLGANRRQNHRTGDLPVASGRLLLSDSNLFFISNAQFANNGPGLKLPLAAVTEARLEKHLFSQILVVHSHSDECNAFAIWKTNAFGQDRTARQGAFEFIQSKIKSSKLEK